MSQEISLKQAERRVFKIAFNDGLWDILIGCVVLLFAIAPLLSSSLGDFWSSFVFLPFWLLICIGIAIVRKYVVKPRMGSVKFGSFRKARLTKLTYVMLAVNIIAFAVGLFFAFRSDISLGIIHSAVLGYLVLVISSIAAYFLNITRLFIYGLLFVVSLIIGEWLFVHFKTPHHGFPIAFGITAGIIILTGLVLFLRILREYPTPMKESHAEDGYR